MELFSIFETIPASEVFGEVRSRLAEQPPPPSWLEEWDEKDQALLDKVREGSRDHALFLQSNGYFLCEYQPAGFPEGGRRYGYTVRHWPGTGRQSFVNGGVVGCLAGLAVGILTLMIGGFISPATSGGSIPASAPVGAVQPYSSSATPNQEFAVALPVAKPELVVPATRELETKGDDKMLISQPSPATPPCLPYIVQRGDTVTSLKKRLPQLSHIYRQDDCQSPVRLNDPSLYRGETLWLRFE